MLEQHKQQIKDTAQRKGIELKDNEIKHVYELALGKYTHNRDGETWVYCITWALNNK
jgi:hypothetical protein